MKRYILAALLTLSSFSTVAVAEENAFAGLQLATVKVDIHDIDSIKRGAQAFATTCMSCHTLRYLQYDKIAIDAGITHDKMPLNVKDWPNGVAPPDLSLEADIRGPNWIYTYLHSFYQDSKRPTGANNLLVPNTAMPAILAGYQGQQELIEAPAPDLYGHLEWYDLLQPVTKGSIPPEEFDAMTRDIVNFLQYAAEPYAVEQERIGYWALAFLALLFVLMYLLKKEYWKDVKKGK